MHDKLRCYHCEEPVVVEKLIILTVAEDEIRLEYNCPACDKWTRYAFRDSWVKDAQRSSNV